MSARITLAFVLVTGCGFHAEPATSDAGGGVPIDARPDAASPLDAPPSAKLCISNTLVTACVAASPSAPVVLPAVIDTDDPAMCAVNVTAETTPDVCIIAGTTIIASAVVSAHGKRPLVLLASDTITFPAGTGLDVAGHVTGVPQVAGPGVATCAFGTAAVKAGGGFGGSFGSIGGAGGKDSGGNAGGKPASAVTPLKLVGGCPGEAGIDTGGTGSPGKAGPAGGAVALLAKQTIALEGVINASGGGGGGATHDNHGGGGGGAGGMIVVDAPAITGSGKLVAVGGGGGEGAGGMTGNAGADPDPSAPSLPAAGGKGGSSGGDGGNGATQPAATAGQDGISAAGGGGGGGGQGLIKRFTATSSGGVLIVPALK